ncbi:copper-translocating P-type ATPase [bacterium]|nr:copper-translocating P-type ATPase [bacterium]
MLRTADSKPKVLPEQKTEEVFLLVSGMSCTSCSQNIEDALGKEKGIIKAKVFLADESAEIVFDPDQISIEKISKRIAQLGYEGKPAELPKEAEVGWAELLFTGLLATPVVFLSMFPESSSKNQFFQMVFSGIILLSTGRRFFTGAFRSIWNKSLNMDVLVAIGIGTSWGYSILTLLLPHFGHGGMAHFETASLLVFFILAGKNIELRARHEVSRSLFSLSKLQQEKVRRVENDTEESVDLSQVRIGDTLRILPGERYPTDGNVEFGESNADESLITGEAMPVHKTRGNLVYSGTLNQTGELLVQITKDGPNSTLQTIIRTVRRAQADKPSIQRFADKASGIFVPFILALSAVTFFGWYISGGPFNISLMHSIAVLVVACPCALGLATPTALLVSSGIALKHGVLVKKGSALEALAKIKFLLIDKTGTLTEGKPIVQKIDLYGNLDRQEIFQMVCSLAHKSIHPLSIAILGKLNLKPQISFPFEKFEELHGFGLSGIDSKGTHWMLGNKSLLEENGLTEFTLPVEYQENSLTPVFFARDRELLAIFGLADFPRKEAKQAISRLESLGVEVIMVTGDRSSPAKAIGNSLGIEKIISEVLPAGKLKVVRDYLAQGPLAFVGDGINDAPALSASTVGIAVGSSADVAREAGDLLIPQCNLSIIPFAIELSRATLNKIKQNLGWAVIYNIIALPLASGVLTPIFGESFSLSPEVCGMTMALSSVSVVANSLLLRRGFFKPLA